RSGDGYRGREPEEDPVEEPEPLAGHGDQFDAHPNPRPGNMNGWVDDNDDVELEAEELDGVPEATIRTGSQRQFVVREREILHHDLSGVEETLGKVVERLKVLQSEENATLRKNLAEKEVLLDLTRMEMEQELYNLRMKGMDIDGYTNRFHELALLCPRMVEPEAVKVEQYIRGLTKSIRGDVTSSQPATINDAVRLAYQLAGQLIQDKADEATEGEKRKGKSDRGGRGDNRREHNRR
nr:hypothetical protein [Tanacetum cinerariifolium]